MPRPNIVFIMADQLAAAFVGCYGSGIDTTPTLDRLAARGVRFDRCYAHVPVCAPNRATIFTGRSFEVHGVTTNNLVLKTDNPTFARVLADNGYRTGGFGKFHLTPMQQPLPEDFSHLGFDESVPTEDPKLGAWLDWVEREHPEHYETALAMSWPMPYTDAYGPDRRDLRDAMSAARARIVDPLRAASDWWLMYPSPLPKELHQTTYITDLSLDFMQGHLAGHADEPFMCFVSYVDPHDPYDPPAPYDVLFAPEDMPEPIPAEAQAYSSQILEQTRDFGDFRSVDGNVEVLKKLRALYLGSVRFIDDQVSRIVRFLEENNQLDNTIIVFTTDHGDMMGDHGFITKGVMHYDKCARCPLIVAGPGIQPGASGRLTSSLDFFPTFCDWADVACRPTLEGKSFAPSCSDGAADDGWPAVTVQAPLGRVRSIITDDGWRLTLFDEECEGEMFNLMEDPEERINLYGDPAWAEKRLELHQRHARAYMQSCGVLQYRNLPVENGRRCVLGTGLGKLEPLC